MNMVEAKALPPIAEGARSLRIKIEALNNLVAQLSEKLEPVLCSPKPSATAETKALAQPGDSSLFKTFKDLEDQIPIYKLEDILNRLEV